MAWGARGASAEEQERVRRAVLVPLHRDRCTCAGDIDNCEPLTKAAREAPGDLTPPDGSRAPLVGR